MKFLHEIKLTLLNIFQIFQRYHEFRWNSYLLQLNACVFWNLGFLKINRIYRKHFGRLLHHWGELIDNLFKNLHQVPRILVCTVTNVSYTKERIRLGRCIYNILSRRRCWTFSFCREFILFSARSTLNIKSSSSLYAIRRISKGKRLRLMVMVTRIYLPA